MTTPKYTLVPPNVAPKRLTAFAPLKTLREQAMAFWNANHPSGKETVPKAASTPQTVPLVKLLPVAAVPLPMHLQTDWAAVADMMNKDTEQSRQFRHFSESMASVLMRKHIVGMRTVCSIRTVVTEALPLQDREYLARRQALLTGSTFNPIVFD